MNPKPAAKKPPPVPKTASSKPAAKVKLQPKPKLKPKLQPKEQPEEKPGEEVAKKQQTPTSVPQAQVEVTGSSAAEVVRNPLSD